MSQIVHSGIRCDNAAAAARGWHVRTVYDTKQIVLSYAWIEQTSTASWSLRQVSNPSVPRATCRWIHILSRLAHFDVYTVGSL
jgi:hypothetical protein